MGKACEKRAGFDDNDIKQRCWCYLDFNATRAAMEQEAWEHHCEQDVYIDDNFTETCAIYQDELDHIRLRDKILNLLERFWLMHGPLLTKVAIAVLITTLTYCLLRFLSRKCMQSQSRAELTTWLSNAWSETRLWYRDALEA